MVVKGAAATVATVAPSTWKSTLRVPAGTKAGRETCPATDEPALRPSSFGAPGVGAGAGVPAGVVPPAGMSLTDPPLPPQEMAAASAEAASSRRTEARLNGLLGKRAPREKGLDACRGITRGSCGIFAPAQAQA